MFEAVTKFAGLLGSAVELASVIETPSTTSVMRAMSNRFLPASARELMESHEQAVEEQLVSMQKKMSDAGIRASRTVSRGDVVKSLVSGARESGAGLVVMSTHGSTGTKAFWNESVSNKVSSACEMPVLLIPLRDA